jgi:hypothetical protein
MILFLRLFVCVSLFYMVVYDPQKVAQLVRNHAL